MDFGIGDSIVIESSFIAVSPNNFDDAGYMG